MARLFGTDGVRGVANSELTCELALQIGRAAATVLTAADNRHPKILIGKDTRLSGDMFELGSEAEKEHQDIVDFIEDNFEKNIYLIGKNFFKTKTKKTVHKFSSFEDLKQELKDIELNNATVLIKGSRGMALERILEVL